MNLPLTAAVPLLLLTLLACPVPAQAKEGKAEGEDKSQSQDKTHAGAAAPVDPYGMRLWQLAMLKRGPAYTTVEGKAREVAMSGHFSNMKRLSDAGLLVLAGPFTVPKDAPADAFAGLFLFDVTTREKALELCRTDPSIEAGIFTVDLLTWYGPSDVTFRGDPWPPPGPLQLFNGKDLFGWYQDIPKRDQDPELQPTFVVKDGLLTSLGRPQGHLITYRTFRNYRLVVEYRWPGRPGNCGILVHASEPRMLYKMFPRSIECQMNHGHAGDFWCIGEDIAVPDMEARRGKKEKWGVTEGKARRIVNLTDGSEKPLKEWNRMVIECRGNTIDVFVNGDHVNHGFDCTTDHGQIAIQAEGAVCEFRRVELTPLRGPN